MITLPRIISARFRIAITVKLRIILTAMRKSVQLLNATSGACLLCGNMDRKPRHPSFASLCTACFDQIPWITRIECQVCGRPEYCPDCSRRSDAAFIWNRSAVRYNALIREWLALYKYRGHEALAPLLGEMLLAAYHGLIKTLNHQHPLPLQSQHPIDAIIPVPVSSERLAEREFNQAERLGAYLAEHTLIPLHNVLERTRHSGKQSYKTRGARLRDTHNLFTANPALTGSMLSSLDQPHIRLIVVDDIYTTGSTANACAAALADEIKRQQPAALVELFVLTLARS
ncbi:ComF family protein [Paenibacillus taihuensis]|uniref:ComF family protein n=1 Tax=Paenibacillus taihuensis TaxID=1156355 RepID=A0A3D9S6L8_9BACL|nr:ComF family protein [Paenibacillus taihuensis]REE84475.1 ComF family protein [Paenibacillus taihuensis]